MTAHNLTVVLAGVGFVAAWIGLLTSLPTPNDEEED